MHRPVTAFLILGVIATMPLGFAEEARERTWRRPTGWVGDFPPGEDEPDRDESPSETDDGVEIANDAASDTPPSAEDDAPGVPDEVAPVERPDTVSPPLLPPARLTINPEGLDIPQAQAPRSRDHDFSNLAGEFTWSNDDVKEPQYVYVQYGFSTTIELLNGEQPSGGAFCGLCGPDGAFEVTALSNRVGIKPREMSAADDPKRGVLATNLTVFTNTGRTLTFIVVEVTGLGLRRTDRHEVRTARGNADMVVDWTLQAQVDTTAREIEARYVEKLDAESGRILEAKAEQAFESYGDFEFDEKSKRGRRVTLESVATIGDRTIIKFHAPADVALGAPVAMVEYGDEIRVLRSVNVSKDVKTVDGESWAFFIMTVEAAHLTGKQRLAVSVSDLDHGREMRSSAGRV